MKNSLQTFISKSNSILSHEPITPNSYRNNSVQPFSKEEEALSVICNSIQPQDGKIEYIEVEVPAGMVSYFLFT